ncbi:hypothetical protein SKAU_G00122490 [Synaphobranchus kaupii]|uniref:Phospholipid phosphatase-related protein type 5 n=1 Tax=Synaphobranchus kaupii TaxID=118154 RepID=A0A9Q1FP02_SYNKA|nr:hypothetical protein SKAU_G00122490 [Synaphobranchus kaupii]
MFYFQLVIMAGTVLLAYYFEYTDTFPVHIQGFFCYDKAFSKPYPGPEDNSKAPPVLVYSLVTAIPTVTAMESCLRSQGQIAGTKWRTLPLTPEPTPVPYAHTSVRRSPAAGRTAVCYSAAGLWKQGRRNIAVTRFRNVFLHEAAVCELMSPSPCARCRARAILTDVL